ncbi:MAG: Holliday junction DNA helicase RuvB C-terminal domain-containing protein [Fervidobacterium sp.]
MQSGFIARSARGRIATEKAYKYLGYTKSPGGLFESFINNLSSLNGGKYDE